jgi:hypothetical protein
MRVVELVIMTLEAVKVGTLKTDHLVKVDKGCRFHNHNEGNIINKCNV